VYKTIPPSGYKRGRTKDDYLKSFDPSYLNTNNCSHKCMITPIEPGIAHRHGCFRAPKETPSATTRGSSPAQCNCTRNKRRPHFEKPRTRLNPTTHKSKYLRKEISAGTQEVLQLPLHLSQKSNPVGIDGGFIRLPKPLQAC
jgi:hypothetical protein